MIKLKQLRRFVSKRNKSEYSGNLQFDIDANSCGFKAKDLGDVVSFTIDGFRGYEWKVDTDEGKARLIEFGRTIYLADNDDDDTKSMLKLMDKAILDEKKVA